MEDDILINPFDVQEEGCPIVGERSELNLTMVGLRQYCISLLKLFIIYHLLRLELHFKLDGEWRMPYASLNWIADIGMALYNRSVSMSLITAICPRIILSHRNVSSQTNVTWTLLWKCPKLHGEFELGCWPQSNLTVSKYICWNNKENRDLYMMVSATDHDQFIVLVRCSPGEPGKPSEGMSWAILSRQIPLNLDVADALLSLLVGYGFDVNEFQTQLAYDDCPAVV
ncbi:unnamed protein product [Orchesella dallaii]|uniref:Uncharacterized protein n=1 Tax=Orchesella dallaii TaxID=48710 RepID=A0ABP1RXF9_9HEXA